MAIWEGCIEGPQFPAHHFSNVLRAEVHATRPPVHLVVVEAGPAHGWCVDDGCHVHKVVEQHVVEQGLITVLHIA